MKYDVIIGIDPSGVKQKLLQDGKTWSADSRRTGYCEIHKGEPIPYLYTKSFWEVEGVLSYVASNSHDYKVLVVIENPDNQGAFYRITANNKSKRERQNRDLGKNQCAANLLASRARYLGFDVLEITPQQKGPKVSERYFRAETGYKGEVSEHAIDAYYIAKVGYNKFKLESKTIKAK